MPTRVPSGSTITRVYFTVIPYIGATYSVGGEHDTLDSALDAAADHFAERVITFKETGLPEKPPFPMIVERWLIEYPKHADPSGSVDMPMERMATDDVLLKLSRDRRGLTGPA
jgi:hypothetical protein